MERLIRKYYLTKPKRRLQWCKYNSSPTQPIWLETARSSNQTQLWRSCREEQSQSRLSTDWCRRCFYGLWVHSYLSCVRGWNQWNFSQYFLKLHMCSVHHHSVRFLPSFCNTMSLLIFVETLNFLKLILLLFYWFSSMWKFTFFMLCYQVNRTTSNFTSSE